MLQINSRVITIALLVLYLCALVGCVPAPVNSQDGREAGPGQTPTAIDQGDAEGGAVGTVQNPAALRIAQIGNLTAAGNELVLPSVRAVEDRVAEITEMDNGAIDLLTLDSGGVLERARDAWALAVSSEDTTAIILWDADLADDLTDEIHEWGGLTLVPYASRALLGPDGPENLYSLTPPGDIQMLHLLRYLRQDWSELRPDGAGDEIRLAVLHWPNDLGMAALTPVALTALDQYNVVLAYEGILQISYTEEVEPLLRAAARAEANLIYVQGAAHAPAIVLNEVWRLGLGSSILVTGSGETLDSSVYGYLMSPDLLDGYLTPTNLAWWTDVENPEIEAARALWEKNDRTVADLGRGRLLGLLALEWLWDVWQTDQRAQVDRSFLDAWREHDNEEGCVALGAAMWARGGRYPGMLAVRRVTGFRDFEIVESCTSVPRLP